MDKEKEDENLENKNTEEIKQEETKVQEKKDDEVLEKKEEVKSEEISKEEETKYVPEQLDDDDFDKEKEQIKAEKKAKKLAKKQEQEKAKNDGEENDGGAKKKSNKRIITIIIVALILIAAIGGVAGYFIVKLNNPENVVNDFAIYFSNEEWDNVANLVDMRGFLTLSLIDTEISEAEENDEEASVSYMDYDTRYETVYEDLETAGYYDEIMEIIEYGEENNSEILSTMFEGYDLTIESIKNTEKIEGTDSLYKITLLCTLTYDSEDSTNTYEVYVSKTDGEYKLVGGDLPYLVYTAYVYYQYYSSYSS